MKSLIQGLCPDISIAFAHGQMEGDQLEDTILDFMDRKYDVLVCTNIVESGVDIPNVNTIIVNNAHQFGLSDLHQLRGRVGRGAEKSYCILMTGDKLSKEAQKRMETMVQTNDGFEISEVDLQLRGPGDLMGTQQSGVLDLKISNLSKDGQIVTLAREMAKKLLSEDAKFEMPKNQILKNQIQRILRSKPNWGRIA
jgi:ATP-dependent DNA helicase RecG